MKVVIDTGVLLSAIFFGGYAQKIIEAVQQGRIAAYVTREIAEEYDAAVAAMEARTGGRIRKKLAVPFTARLHIVEPKATTPLCLEAADDKFIACALAANAVYVIGEDKDVTFIGSRRSVKIINAEGVCQLLTLCA